MKSIFFFTAVIVLIFSSGCSRSQDQAEFEQRAYRNPASFTETSPDGQIVREDESDWQIGPMFQGYVEVEIPAFPNPTRGEPVNIQLLITGVGSVNGLRAVGFYDMFDDRTMRTFYVHDQSQLEFEYVEFSINPAEFGFNNAYHNARQVNNGLHRLFIYDNNFNLITYGDIQLK